MKYQKREIKSLILYIRIVLFIVGNIDGRECMRESFCTDIILCLGIWIWLPRYVYFEDLSQYLMYLCVCYTEKLNCNDGGKFRYKNRFFGPLKYYALTKRLLWKAFTFYLVAMYFFVFFLVYFPNETQCALSLRTPSMPIRTSQSKQWDSTVFTHTNLLEI